MPRTLLLEAGFLSLPDNLFGVKIPDCRQLISDLVAERRLQCSRLRVWLTSHRIGVLIEGLSEQQADITKEVRGPKASVAYDLNNQPTPAATGFAAAQGLELKDLITKEVDGEKFLFANKQTSGQNLDEILERLVDEIFAALPIVKMPWTRSSIFPQPPIYFCVMLDDSTPEITFEELKSVNYIQFARGASSHKVVLDHALSYPGIMKQNSILCDLSERISMIEADITAALPEDYHLRAVKEKFERLCAFAEGISPVLVKYDARFLEMPDAVLNTLISEKFGYLPCEDSHGKILPAVVAFACTDNVSDESQVRSAMLELELNTIASVWNTDVRSLPERFQHIAEQHESDNADLSLDQEGPVFLRLVSFISANASYSPEETRSLNLLASLILEGEKTELARLLPGTGFSVVLNRIKGVEEFAAQAKALEEICAFFAGKTAAPSSLGARATCLALLCRSVVEPSCFMSGPEIIADYLIASKQNIDLFSVFANVFPSYKVDRRAWLERVLSGFSQRDCEQNLKEAFSSTKEFDPYGFSQLIDEWEGKVPDDLDSLVSLFGSVKHKVDQIKLELDTKPEEGLETEITVKLSLIEATPGINYLKIYKFFIDEKVNIQACLLGLPAVLDDNDSSQTSRIAVLQRIFRLFVRLPFITHREKANKRNEH